jgi:hypothetical protein
MRTLAGLFSVLCAASAAALAACSVPTDQDTTMYVSVSSPSPILLRGSVADLSAHLWVRDANGDSSEVRNAELFWNTSDEQLATITPGGGPAIGRVTGINSGVVEVRAVARGYANALPGVFSLRIANPLEIDSITPDTVRYGQLVVAYGVGVGSLFFAGLGNATLGIDSLAVTGDPHGLGSRSFWVAYPATTGTLFAAGSGQLVFAAESTVVFPFDIYEPNEASPAVIPLDGQAPYPATPAVRFFNPALAFEEPSGASTIGIDWYRWTTADPAKPYTFLFVGPALGRTHGTFLTSDARTTNSSSWRLGPGMYDCKGFNFRPPVAASDSVFIALGKLPANFVDLVSAYTQQGRYALAVVQSYEVADKRIPADRFEENDLCVFADANFNDPAKRIDLSSPFAENLTIDTPHEIDWLRFRVPGALPLSVTVRTAAYPLGKNDRTDLDTYILRVPVDSRGLELVGSDAEHGSAESTTMLLDPGDYYLAVVDSAGVPTHYGVCIAAGATCTLPPPPTLPTQAPSLGPAIPQISIPMPADVPRRRRAAQVRPWR